MKRVTLILTLLLFCSCDAFLGNGQGHSTNAPGLGGGDMGNPLYRTVNAYCLLMDYDTTILQVISAESEFQRVVLAIVPLEQGPYSPFIKIIATKRKVVLDGRQGGLTSHETPTQENAEAHSQFIWNRDLPVQKMNLETQTFFEGSTYEVKVDGVVYNLGPEEENLAIIATFNSIRACSSGTNTNANENDIPDSTTDNGSRRNPSTHVYMAD